MKKKSLQAINKNSRLTGKGYEFWVGEDKLEGVVRPIQMYPKPIELADIAETLKINAVQYGIVEPARLIEALADNATPQAPWTIANGQPPVPGEKAELVYHFETDPLRIGTLKETGFMDYKDRGKIPQVKAGTLVAEKIAGKKGIPGIDIFGQPVHPPKVPDVRLRCGRGVALSADGLKATATADGRPVRSADGKVHVFEDLNIKGDIGIRTGHVDFDGHIDVAGIVNAGYKVKGGSLCTREANTAEADIVGNINVLGGVYGSRLKAGGNIRARYIHQSTIEARGDVIVDRDVSNSTIIAGGTVIVDNGKILTSKVQARKGITAAGIGSKASETCELIVGIDSRMDEALEVINRQISEKETRRLELEALLGDYNDASDTLEQTIAAASEVQTAAREKLTQLTELLNSPQSADPAVAWKIKSEMGTLRSASERSLATIIQRRDEHQLLFEKIADLRQEMEGVEKELARLEDVIRELDEFSRIKAGVFERNPVVETLGIIHAGTSIRGPHATLVIGENHRRVRIVEIRLEKKNVAHPWRMVVKRR
ncbi:hypothetical protein DSCA_34350 [Desulfosarcina alkanivorans]|uniref:Flagellar Assembly Protein A N-terminal region domain-containing protein n=1 Tax=Desulfosarcina alkanivorans TaxID=571177 RepID=A0A5K7YM93_9BACT|nr:FapA family protein [Desulfosarcina alkanivorans]BBO69505.1 hypothetical protein DSCA_34350 [Desulfosarcina alkanivorans]